MKYTETDKLVETYRDSILRLAFTYLKNRSDAEDIAQDVFIAYIKNHPNFVSKKKEKAWLLTVTANKCKNFLKSAWNRRTTDLRQEIAYLQENEILLLDYIMQLDEKYRLAIHLYYYEGYSTREIAGFLGSNQATVGTWLARARKQLKSMMGVDLDG